LMASISTALRVRAASVLRQVGEATLSPRQTVREVKDRTSAPNVGLGAAHDSASASVSR
jgi:hypothetical protein